MDTTTVGATIAVAPLVPEQVVAWDGIGGALDGVNFAGSRPSVFLDNQQVDAIANHRDFLFNQVIDDTAHLIFSHDNIIFDGSSGTFGPLVPSAGPVVLSNGMAIGGAGEVSVEVAGAFSPPETQTVWAVDTSVNGMPTPIDIDGVEVWGPEPATTADSDKYSLEVDIIAGMPVSGAPAVSVFSYDSTTGMSMPYIAHSTIVSAVGAALGGLPAGGFFSQHLGADIEAINIDALMVQDREGSRFEFDREDEIIFSINQMANTAGAYYATGSEIFVLKGDGSVSFLSHGGHTWDMAYAMARLRLSGNQGIIDINAIEAISEFSVPEPSSFVLSGLALAFLAYRVRRR